MTLVLVADYLHAADKLAGLARPASRRRGSGSILRSFAFELGAAESADRPHIKVYRCFLPGRRRGSPAVPG